MKLLPVTLTLFDKLTNSTYRGTLLLRNLEEKDTTNKSRASNSSLAEDLDPYDSRGAGLFIILVISVYALSIVLFIVSFIKKNATVNESLEENTVNTYLQKVGDLKEKTVREHFKKLKMSIIDQVDSGNRAVKDMPIHQKSEDGSVNVSQEKPETVGKRGVGVKDQTIRNTGLVSRDDVTLPLLGSGESPNDTSPTSVDSLSVDYDVWGIRPSSPSLRRASMRALESIPETETEDVKEYRPIGDDTSHKSPQASIQPQIDTEKPSASGLPGLKRPQFWKEEDRGTVPYQSQPQIGTRGVHQHLDPNAIGQQALKQPNWPSPSQVKRPRPKSLIIPKELPGIIWNQLSMPPAQRSASPSSPHLLSVSTPTDMRSDVWVLRNGRKSPVEGLALRPAPSRTPSPGRPMPGPGPGLKDPGRPMPGPGPEVKDPGRPMPGPGPEVKDPGRPMPGPGPEVKDPGRPMPGPGPEVKEQMRRKPPPQLKLNVLSPIENRSRSPSPRSLSHGSRIMDTDLSRHDHSHSPGLSPTEQTRRGRASPGDRTPKHSPVDRFPPSIRVKELGSDRQLTPTVGTQPQPSQGQPRDKATVKITLGLPPGLPGTGIGPASADPTPSGHSGPSEGSEPTGGQRPSRVKSAESATFPRLQRPQFPVTFNSPEMQRRNLRLDDQDNKLQISRV